MSRKAPLVAGAALAIAPLHPSSAADGTVTPDNAGVPTVPAWSALPSFRGVTASGYIAASYYHSDGYPSNIHEFDTRHDSFQLDQAGFSLAYQPKQGFGALLDLMAGEDARIVHLNEDGHEKSFDLRQAYLQYATGPLTVIAGKFVTLAGAEVINPTLNTNFSRSLLFTKLEPLDHTGVRASIAVTDTLTVIGGVNNGWNVTSASFGSRTGEAGLVWAPDRAFSLATTAYLGRTEFIPGTTTRVDADRTLVDVVATYNATAALTFIVNADWLRQDHAFAPGAGDATMYGVAGYVNYAFNDRWRVSVRGEYLNDEDGFLTATPGGQHLWSGTVTFGYAPTRNFELRIEARHDASQKGFFLKTDPDTLAPGTEPVLGRGLSQFALQGLFKF